MTPALYRLLLRCCPREFRDQFGDELLATAEAASAAQRPGARLRAFVDAVRTVIGLRRDVRRERRTPAAWSGWGRDLRLAARSLGRQPGFTLFITLTLAVALGSMTAIGAIADRLLLTGPSGLTNGADVSRIELVAQVPGRGEVVRSTFGYVLYAAIRDRATTADAASYARNEGALGTGATARRLWVGYTSEEFLPLLGVSPARGRLFVEDDYRRDTDAVVISTPLARAEFGDRDPLGQTLLINGRPRVVIGITPQGFTGAELTPVDVWLPIDPLNRSVTPEWQTTWHAQWLQIVVRRRPAATDALMADEFTGILRQTYDGTSPVMGSARLRGVPLTVPRDSDQAGDVRVLRWLTAVAALIFVVACANVMTVLLVRGVRRRRDLSLQLALGATRGTIIRSVLCESALLSLVGAAAGFLVAVAVMPAAAVALFPQVDWQVSLLNTRMLGALALLMTVTTALVGLLPALAAGRLKAMSGLRSQIDVHAGRSGWGRVLIAAQAAVSVVLLVGAGLFVRSFWNARHLDLGVDADRIVIAEVIRARPQGADAAARRLERERGRRMLVAGMIRASQLPGVDAAAIAVGMPFGFSFGTLVGTPDGQFVEPVPHSISAVSANYFETVGTQVPIGRVFSDADGPGTTPVAIVSAHFASLAWPGSDALGRCLTIDGPACVQVVGVAEDTHRQRLLESPVPHIYVPLGQEQGFGGDVLLVRGRGDLDAVVRELPSLLAAGDTSVERVTVESLRSRIDPQMHAWRLGASVFVGAGLLALLVAAVGTYGVLAHLVAARRREVGIRLALGATSAHVRRGILRSGLLLVAAGVLVGLAVAWVASVRIGDLLFGVPPRDPFTYGVVAVTLLMTAALASIVPAQRASRTDPLIALKAD
jgi:predicted permease